MKAYKYLAVFIIIGILSSCEDVIEIDLNSANPVVVAEGNISQNQVCSLRLNYTTDYFDSETPSFIDDAVVTLSNSAGESEVLTYTQNGFYIGQNILGACNLKYKLDINVANQEFDGSSSILTPTVITGLHLVESDFERPNPNKKGLFYNLNIEFTDNPVEDNYYLLKIIQINGNEEVSSILIDDHIFAVDGIIAYTPRQSRFSEGDTLNVRLYSIDQDTYLYYSQLNNISGSGRRMSMGASSTPYNPKSNLGENIMGYFTAWSYVDTTVVVLGN